MRRSESEPLAKSGRLISVSSDVFRTSPTVFRSAARREFWILVKIGRVRSAYWSGNSGVERPMTRGGSLTCFLPVAVPGFYGMPSERVHGPATASCAFVAPKVFKRGGSAAAEWLHFHLRRIRHCRGGVFLPRKDGGRFLRNHADGIAAMDLFRGADNLVPAALWPADYALWPAASRAGTNSVLMMNERRPRSGHYADGNLRAAESANASSTAGCRTVPIRAHL